MYTERCAESEKLYMNKTMQPFQVSVSYSETNDTNFGFKDIYEYLIPRNLIDCSIFLQNDGAPGPCYS